MTTLLAAARANDGAGLRAMQEAARKPEVRQVLRIILERTGLLSDDAFHDSPVRMAANVAWQSMGRELLHWIEVADPDTHGLMLREALAEQMDKAAKAEREAAEERAP